MSDATAGDSPRAQGVSPLIRKKITRREFVKLVGAGSAAAALGCGLPLRAQTRKPNVIVILADDLGYADAGFQGAKDLLTPNIDSIAANGARFTDAYVSAPMCSPSRAGILTGIYQQRFGHEFNPGPTGMDANFGMPITQTTLAQRMKAAGYVTGAIGKWHLGKTEDRSPTKRGFDEYASGDAFDHPIASAKENKGEQKPFHVDFIDRHKDHPFFLYVATGIPHAPLEPSDESVARFSGIADETRRKLAAWMYELDKGVGEILDAVRRHGLEQNTIIFFLSDNGAPNKSNGSLNSPFRGYKMELYEGGIRVPFAVQWKGIIPAGTTYRKPVISLDIAATALAAAGAGVEPGTIDGVDLAPFLKGGSGTPHDALYWRTGPRHAVRSGKWKLLKLGDAPAQLYDLEADPGETQDLASKQPKRVRRLEKLYARWDKQLAKPLWQERAGAAD